MRYILIKPRNRKPESSMLVTQSNRLIEARYTLSLYEQRLVLIMIAMVEPHDEDFKDYIIKISDFSELLGLKNKNVYSQIKNILLKLRERTLLIPKGKQNYLITGWISSAEYLGNEGIIKLSFDAKLKPYLLALKSNFTKHKLGEVIKFKGVYTIRIYSLLKQYEKLGTRSFSVDEFRKILGIKDNQYLLFSDLKKRAILQAQKEFNRKNKDGYFYSDINFELITEKTGRKITDLKFIIKRQKVKTNQKIEIEDSLVTPHPKELTPPLKPKANKPTRQPSLSPAVKALSRYNISERRAKNYEADQGEEAILSCIKLYEDRISQGQVQNKSGGYLISMLEAKAGMISQAQMEAEKKKEEETRLKIKAEQEKRLEDYKHTLIVKFERGIRKQYLGSLTPLEKETLWEEIKPLFENVSQYLIQEGKELESPVVGIELSKRIPNYEERKDNYINLKMAEKRQELFGNIDDF